MTQPIQLISGPRNISTAMMYSFGNRPDTAIVDEPFYAHYLDHTGIDHPGRKDTLASMSKNINEILESVVFKERKEKYLFIKNMAHHMIGFDTSYSFRIRNIFLIRDPKKLIASFAKVIENPTSDDLGLEREVMLYQEIKEKGRFSPVVIDTGEVLKNPEKVLTEMCSALEIPFHKSMLSWKTGPRKEDGIWAKYWYKSVHNSTHFEPQKSEDTRLSDHLLPLYEQVLPHYELLFQQALKA